MTAETVSAAERMTITRIFDAAPEVVWKAWTDPQYARQWWGPKGFTSPVYKMDFRVGGKFLICMRSPEGQNYWSSGEYVAIEPGKRIEFSMYFADANGNKVDAAAYGIEHTAMEDVHDVVLFEAVGNGQTKLTYIGNETMQDAMESGQVDGWNQILDKFAAVLPAVKI